MNDANGVSMGKKQRRQPGRAPGQTASRLLYRVLYHKQLKFNTLYLAVYRLEANGHIYISEKRAEGSHLRVYYAITPQGEEYYQSLKATFVSFTGIIDHLLALDDELRAKGENNV